MPGGSKLSSAIGDGIASSPHFVGLLSRRYLGSNWCIDELEEAERRARDGQLRILPLLLEAGSALDLEDLAPERRRLFESIVGRYSGVHYDRNDPLKSGLQVAEAIGQHVGIAFAPIERKKIEGVELQLIEFRVTAPKGRLPTDFLQSWECDIEHEFVAYTDRENKPLRGGVPVALSGKGPNWLYACLALKFKNLCPVYVRNKSEYIRVYDLDQPVGKEGAVLRAG